MPSSLRTWCLAAALALGALCSAGTSAAAQETYPNQNVRLVVAFPAGGPTDSVARILGQRLNEKWGQGVVIENRGGAGGNIAARQVAKAEPNGYTLLVTTSAYAVNPSLTKNAGYVPETDFKTVIVAGTTPNIFVASPQLKASNLKELFELAKTEKLTYGMPGPGTTPHLSAEKMFKIVGQVDIPAVPFTGASPLLNALLGGHITLACQALPPTIEHIKAGKLKALAVISDKRIPSLPDVPTALEQGFGDGEEATWIAVFAPAATPVPVLTKLNADLNAVLAEAPIRERFEQIGVLPVGGTLAKSETYVHAEIKKWGEVVRKIGLRID
jgi:tripartite-type tricarboxylate transporter receptor subunit TctC